MGGPRQAGHHSGPSKIGGATCQPYVRGGRVRQLQTCLASHPHIAGSRGIAQIATGQHDDDALASPSTPALADSAPTERSAGLSSLHSPQALSARCPSALLCDELAFQMTRATVTNTG